MPKPESAHIDPSMVDVREATSRGDGDKAYKFHYADQDRGLQLEGMLDTQVPVTLVDVVRRAYRKEQLGSYSVAITLSPVDANNPNAVQDVIAAILPDILPRHDASPGDGQLPLW